MCVYQESAGIMQGFIKFMVESISLVLFVKLKFKELPKEEEALIFVLSAKSKGPASEAAQNYRREF